MLMICGGHSILGSTVHEVLHWLLASVFVLGALFLNWVISSQKFSALKNLTTSIDTFWWLVFVVSLSACSHYVGDEIIRLPFWEFNI